MIRHATLPAFTALAVLLALAGGCDPVQGDAVSALPDEVAGVGPGPLHRAGQPCTLCHDGSIGSPGEFAVAGTVFLQPGSGVGVKGALVSMTDATLTTRVAKTNEAGNFFLKPDEWTPVFPLRNIVVTSGATTVTMYSEVGRDGSCGKCHIEPAGPASPGHITLQSDDGGGPL
ncbi:MAG: hypothetical protein ABI193_26100 [Minicystis sp.]